MKKFKLLACVVLSTLLFSCSKDAAIETPEVPEVDHTEIIEFSFEDATTRAINPLLSGKWVDTRDSRCYIELFLTNSTRNTCWLSVPGFGSPYLCYFVYQGDGVSTSSIMFSTLEQGFGGTYRTWIDKIITANGYTVDVDNLRFYKDGKHSITLNRVR